MLIQMAAGFLFLAASAADASTLQDMGNTTYDSSTSLSWLDLTYTNGQSVNDALSANSGYRVATQAEVMQLYSDADLPTVTGGSPSILGTAADLVALLGFTSSGIGQYGTQGYSLGTDGLYNDPFVGVYFGDGFGYVYAGNYPPGWMSGSALGSVGVYLVREIAPVPLPAGAMMLLSALGLLAAARKAKRTA